MDIKSLLELACAKVASMIKGMTIPETRKFFNIENDFSPEEEAQIMDENKWAEESFWSPKLTDIYKLHNQVELNFRKMPTLCSDGVPGWPQVQSLLLLAEIGSRSI